MSDYDKKLTAILCTIDTFPAEQQLEVYKRFVAYMYMGEERIKDGWDMSHLFVAILQDMKGDKNQDIDEIDIDISNITDDTNPSFMKSFKNPYPDDEDDDV